MESFTNRIEHPFCVSSLSCFLTILDNFSNDKIVPVKNLVTHTFMTSPRSKVFFAKSFEEDRILVSNIS